jgi:hypothetical protein
MEFEAENGPGESDGRSEVHVAARKRYAGAAPLATTPGGPPVQGLRSQGREAVNSVSSI